MGILAPLQAQSIQAAKDKDWALAVFCNQQILEISPDDTSALNRLGMAHLQLEEIDQATQIFERVLSKDSTNVIAKKQLERLKTNQKVLPPSFSAQAFIEEPGKARIIELYRLAGREVLLQLSIGQECFLKPKSRFISIETEVGMYIGALPDDVSYRLSKLIAAGNEYSCFIHSVSKTGCTVFIRELVRARENATQHSFPIARSTSNTSEDGDVTDMLYDDPENPSSMKYGDDEDEIEAETAATSKDDREREREEEGPADVADREEFETM